MLEFATVVGIFTIVSAIANIVVMFKKTAEIRKLVESINVGGDVEIEHSRIASPGVVIEGGNASARALGKASAKVEMKTRS